MYKLIIMVSILSFFCSSSVMGSNPPESPTLYATGPLSPFLSPVDLSVAELEAFSLFESIMKLTEAMIHSKGCAAVEGESSLDVYADEDTNISNFVQVTSLGGTYTLTGQLVASLTGFGDKIKVTQSPVSGFFEGFSVRDFDGLFKFNDFKNMLVGDSKVKIQGGRGYNQYAVKIIKDFYRGNASDPNTLDYYIIFDWGLQSVSKLGFPTHKYWHRSKSSRSDGLQARTVWVSDALVGSTKCRITIDTEGYNYPDFFFQQGILKVESDKTPSDPVVEFSELPFI